ncbi:MAG: hypothetical protein Q7S26_01400 [bacterium]|nr:hypothetical protein [bacterium]
MVVDSTISGLEHIMDAAEVAGALIKMGTDKASDEEIKRRGTANTLASPSPTVAGAPHDGPVSGVYTGDKFHPITPIR